MKRIACFCIPAHGHHNPMLPVAAELVRRGDAVRFYSFDEFADKIRATGAEYVACDRFLPALSEREEAEMKAVSTTEMAIQDIRISLQMDGFLAEEFAAFQPDVVFSDSVCFWGKLNAWKHGVPLVVSTSTFAFNQLSSGYMKQSPKELAGLIFGLPRLSKELKTLEPCGYHVKNPLTLVQSDNQTDSVVYASRRFQPYAESFSAHYRFVGPSVFSALAPNKPKSRPLVYISLGTVINERPDFYARCIEALRELEVDAVISVGRVLDPAALGPLPENIRVFPYVDQLELLSRADVFLSHCGMNSVSESLYMATPLLLYPQTAEQQAVARRVTELGAGLRLADDSAAGIRAAVQTLLHTPAYAEAAAACSADFRACAGPKGAADFIESAPHPDGGRDLMAELNRVNGRFQLCYWLLVAAVLCALGFGLHLPFIWALGVAAGVAVGPLGKRVQERAYKKLVGRELP